MKIFYFTLFLVFILIPLTLAHSDDIGEQDSMHFMHKGRLTFPVWTYYAEIIEHIAMFIVGVVGFVLVFKTKNSFLLWGFGVFTFSELLTTLHHFLIFPLGVLNAVFNHLLVLISIILIVIGIINFKKGDKDVQPQKEEQTQLQSDS